MYQNLLTNGRRAVVMVLLSAFINLAFGAETDDMTRSRDSNVRVVLRGTTVRSFHKCGYNCTPLEFAAYYNLMDVAEFLLTTKDDVNAISDTGNTPLHAAIEGKHIEMARLLIASGANIHVRNNHGKTPMDLARLLFAGRDVVATLEVCGVWVW